MMNTPHRYPASYLHAITRQLFVAAGTPRHIAKRVAITLINANLAGHDSHGVQFVSRYLERIERDEIAPAAEPTISRETANTLLVDGHHGFGHHTTHQAMEWAIERVADGKTADVCCVGFVNITHMGRLGEYVETAARAGCLGIVTLGSGGKEGSQVVPFGGSRGMLSTNPIAVGAPTGDDTPFVLDFATSIVAGGKILVAQSKGLTVPEGHIVDKVGQPTVNPADLFAGGALMPFGGHKGYALSLLFCLLGGLSGGFTNGSGTLGGLFMQVLNIEAFMSLAEYQKQVRAFLDRIKATPLADGFDQILVPGDMEHQSRVERLKAGIEVPSSVFEQLQSWAEKLNVDLDQIEVEAEDIGRYQL